jgi:SAM-dependent methyltransferase
MDRAPVVSLHAFISDIGQRIVTVNKREQRRALTAWIRRLRLPPGATVLDFGCGTALFARTLHAAGLQYHGYDPDEGCVRYARRLYPDLTFTTQLDAAAERYDVILANCCFHHIPDAELCQRTLPTIARLLRRSGVFLLWDVLPLDETASTVRRAYNVLEQGDCKRTVAQLERLVTRDFTVRWQDVDRFFAVRAPVVNRIFSDLVRFELVLPGHA